MATRELFDLLSDITPNIQESDSRANRRRCKGLPDEAARIDLARTYLKAQAKLWPDLAKGKVLQRRTESSIVEMADKFRQYGRTPRPRPQYLLLVFIVHRRHLFHQVVIDKRTFC